MFMPHFSTFHHRSEAKCQVFADDSSSMQTRANCSNLLVTKQSQGDFWFSVLFRIDFTATTNYLKKPLTKLFFTSGQQLPSGSLSSL